MKEAVRREMDVLGQLYKSQSTKYKSRSSKVVNSEKQLQTKCRI